MSQSDHQKRAIANATRSLILGGLILVGSALAAPSMSPEFPLRGMLAVSYGMVWPFLIAVRSSLMDRSGYFRTVVFVIGFPLLGLSPLLLINKEAYIDVVPIAMIAWSFGSAIAWLARGSSTG